MRKLLTLMVLLTITHFVIAQATLFHVAPVFNGGTSTLRAPSGTSAMAYLRGASIIPASEISTGIPSGTSIKKFGFVYNLGSSTAVTGTLKVYMMNTSDATFLHSVVWDSIVAHSTLVYNGSFTVPVLSAPINQDITLSTPFTYTGSGVYVAYDWYSAGPYATTGATAQSSTVITNGVRMSASATVAPTSLATSSSYRPVMRFGFDNPYTIDANVLQVYTYGKMPIPAANPHKVSAVIKNQGSDTLYNCKTYLNISGVNTFVDSLIIDTIKPGFEKFVSFSNFNPSNLGSNTVTVSLPSDQNSLNNTKSKTLATNQNSFSFSQGTTADGSAGFNSATGDFVAKFSTSSSQGLNQVDVNFASGGNQFKIGVWSVDALGMPDTLIYSTPAYTSTAGVYTVIINPPVMIPTGSFFVGVKQIGTTNVGFQYQTESPIRPNTFFYASPTGDTNWVDFAPNNTFRFMIEPKFAISNDVGVNSVLPAASATIYAGQSVNLSAKIANYGINSQSAIPVKYSINGSTIVGPVTVATTLNVNDTLTVYFTGTNAFTPTTPGTYTIKVFTSLANDQSNANDTITVVYTVQPSSISTFPYIQNFDSAASWTTSGTSNFWIYDNAGAAIGSQSSPNPAVYADFYNNSSGLSAMLKSPVFNISALSNPILRFHVAYRSYSTTEDDSLQIWVSTDNGTSFQPGSPALYKKSNLSNPSLATMTPSNTEFAPLDSTNWRLETVDLSQFSTSQSLIIAFKAISDYGNNCWIDNVILKSATAPLVNTLLASNISYTSYTIGGNVIDDGGKTVSKRGFCWGTTPTPTILNDTNIIGSGVGSFSKSIYGLSAGTVYYVRAYAINSLGTSYGSEIQLTTLSYSLPALTTDTVINITSISAVSGGNVTSNGGNNLTAKGVCWSTSTNPSITNSHTTDGTSIGSFTSNISGLSANTTYYLRAYATNSVGTAYGNERIFTTTSNSTIPVVTTTSATAITYTQAASGGDVSSDGGAAVTKRGVCWSTNQNPTISNDTTLNGNGTGTFISTLTSLTPATTYYVRAYAINSVGVGYGNQITFTTTNPAIPVVTTTVASSISTQSAVSGGEVISENGAAVTARGVCWSLSNNPTINDNHSSDGSGLGIFTSNLSGLTHSTTYYVKAYAVNSVGTAYGALVSFTTLVDGLDETNKPYTLQVFSGENLVFIKSDKSLPKGKIYLTDLNGKTIGEIMTNGSGTDYVFSTENMAKGIYLIRFDLDGFISTQKVLIP